MFLLTPLENYITLPMYRFRLSLKSVSSQQHLNYEYVAYHCFISPAGNLSLELPTYGSQSCFMTYNS